MATNAIAAMLDELMGRNRNLSAEAAAKRPPKWTDSDVCPYYLVDFCPHDVFVNTKADLGPCDKAHDEAMKAAFQKERDKEKVERAMDTFIRFANRLITDLQQRIKRAKDRLVITQNEDLLPTSAPREASDRLRELNTEMSLLVERAEECGTEGNIEEAQNLLKRSEELREEREELRRAHIPNYIKDEWQQQKAMEVCDTCGSFLIVGDAPQRIDDHLTGKLHMGYARIREGLERVSEKRRALRAEIDKERDKRRRSSRERSVGEKSGREKSNRDVAIREKSSRDGASRERTSRDGASKERSSRDGASRERSSRVLSSREKSNRDVSGRERGSRDKGNREESSRDRSREDHRRRHRSRSGDRRRRGSEYDREGRRKRSRSRDERRKY